jgi:hypothetical protein
MCATNDPSPEADRPFHRWWQRLWRWRGRRGEPIVSQGRARQLARSIPLTEPFSLDALVRQIETIAGVPIVLQPFPPRTVQAWRDAGERLPPALCIAGEISIYVFYRVDTTPAHQRHSILHELGHVCARHLPAVGNVNTENLDEATLARAKHRSFYVDEMERAAEAFAYTMEGRIGLMRAHESRSTDPTYQEAVDRYGSILEG